MNKKKSPLVSVIMNCYNGEKYLISAIESVLSQTYKNWEIIFWDNQSTDKTAEIFNSFKDYRLKYYYAEKHTVLYEARNYALNKCKGELIAFLDVDDFWLPEKLENQIILMEDQQFGLSCTNYLMLNERDIDNVKTHIAYKSIPFGDVINDIFKEYFVHISTLMVRKIAIDQLEYCFDSRFNIIGDLDFVVRLCKDWKIASIQEPLAYYRWHKTNTGNQPGFEMSDEFDIWQQDINSKFDFNKYPNFKLLVYKMRKYKVYKLLYDGKRLEAIKISQELGVRFRIKTILATFLPRYFVRRYLYS
jgi:glycosyltransferase involved in cell wall biosynthesis